MPIDMILQAAGSFSFMDLFILLKQFNRIPLKGTAVDLLLNGFLDMRQGMFHDSAADVRPFPTSLLCAYSMARSATAAEPSPLRALIGMTSQPSVSASLFRSIHSPLFSTRSIMLRAMTIGMFSSRSCVVRYRFLSMFVPSTILMMASGLSLTR